MFLIILNAVSKERLINLLDFEDIFSNGFEDYILCQLD